MSYTGTPGRPWQGSLRDLGEIIYNVKRLRVYGRLSLRNKERLSVAHLYFRAGTLVHIVGNRGDARSILAELKEWKSAFVRFDRGVAPPMLSLSEEYEQLLEDVLNHLHKYGRVALPRTHKVIESSLITTAEVKELITPQEWQMLVEAVRRVSLAVAQLVGPKEALNVLRDILDDCSSAFPAFASLRVAPTGYLQVVDKSHLDRMSRAELLEGFAALISICQHFCMPMIGERNAHQLMLKALHGMLPVLIGLGVFRIDNQLLSRDFYLSREP